MDPQFEELAQRLKSELAAVVADQMKKELADQFAAAENRLVGEYKIHTEEMKSAVKLLAEGYGASLDAIDRRLDNLERGWTARFGDHESLLRNHEQRITGLEQNR